MTPLEGDKSANPQVGIAPINSTVKAIKSQYDEFHIGFDPRNIVNDQSKVVNKPRVVPYPPLPEHPELDNNIIIKPDDHTTDPIDTDKNKDHTEQTGHWLP